MKKVFLLGFLALSMVAMAQQVTPVTVEIAELKIDSLRAAYLSQPPMYRTALDPHRIETISDFHDMNIPRVC